jgi:hypothetical protein
MYQSHNKVPHQGGAPTDTSEDRRTTKVRRCRLGLKADPLTLPPPYNGGGIAR